MKHPEFLMALAVHRTDAYGSREIYLTRPGMAAGRSPTIRKRRVQSCVANLTRKSEFVGKPRSLC